MVTAEQTVFHAPRSAGGDPRILPCGDAGDFGVKLDVVRPFRFQGTGDMLTAAESRPSSVDVDTEESAEPSPTSSWHLVASRLALAAASFLTGVAIRRLALAAAIFLAGMATAAGLIFWLRPTIAPPVIVEPKVPIEPDAKAAAESPTETAAPAEVPLPRPRPRSSPGGDSTTGQQGDSGANRSP